MSLGSKMIKHCTKLSLVDQNVCIMKKDGKIRLEKLTKNTFYNKAIQCDLANI